MDTQKTTSRTSLLNLMLLKAWRERWTDSQWGINIKTVLPRGVSGDVYNLADCILQQALIGSCANPLVLSYLRHSLCAHLISHAAVLKRISKYESYEKVYCVTALLDFLDAIMDGVTCRGKPEESVLPNAIVSLVYWLINIFSTTLQKYEINGQLNTEQQHMLDKMAEVVEKIAKNDFLLGILYIGKQEDPELCKQITTKYCEVKNTLANTNYVPKSSTICDLLQYLAYINIDQLEMVELDSNNVETTTFCIQPLLAVEVILNPINETQNYVSELLTVQRLKHYSNVRLYFEIMRAGLLSLTDVIEITYDTMWVTFTFIKVPHIFKQIHAMTQGEKDLSHEIPDVISALEMLLEDSSILDFVDAKCACNTVEYMLNDWAKQNIVDEKHVKKYAAVREPISQLLQKQEAVNQFSIINFVIRAEVPMSGILKTLSSEYSKVQDHLIKMLCQVLVGNSFDLILSVAAVEGKLGTFVCQLIQCNEKSQQVPGEVGLPAMSRQILFDVSFLMLVYIVQTYGSEVVLSENGDTFIEKWIRDCMFQKNKRKSPKSIVQSCDESIVDELLMTLSKPDGQMKSSSLTWQAICMNLPGVLYQVLIAWENDTISATDVKIILENIKRRPFSFSVCAASYLCAYMQTVREDELLKPLNMIQQFLTTLNPDEMTPQEHVKERYVLSIQIIRKMQQNAGKSQIRNAHNLVSHSPLEDQFREVWKKVTECGFLPIKGAQVLYSLLQGCGSVWLVQKLVDEVLKPKYTKDMEKAMDIIFGVMHLDIEKNTIALLDFVLPMLLFNKQQKKHITDPQSLILARLCVYCVIACIDSPGCTTKKRHRSDNDMEDVDMCNLSKIRKLNGDNDTCITDCVPDEVMNEEPSISIAQPSLSLGESTTSNKEPAITIREPLQSSLKNTFKTFSHFVTTDELSPRVYFIFQFISLLVQNGKDRITPILQLIPNTLMQNLLKVMMTDDITIGLICRVYDLHTSSGRQAAITDLCLLRNIRLRKRSVKL